MKKLKSLVLILLFILVTLLLTSCPRPFSKSPAYLSYNCTLCTDVSELIELFNDNSIEKNVSDSTIAAVVDEGAVLDYWIVNGEILDTKDNILVLDVTGDLVIEAVLLEGIEVTSINAYMQMLDEVGNSTGNIFYHKVFNYDLSDLSMAPIRLDVHAEVPIGYTVDFWLINGVPVSFADNSGFSVNELTDSSVFEAVIMEISLPQTTQMPTVTPVFETPVPDNATVTPTPIVPTPYITPTPEMYNVTCINAKFSCHFIKSSFSASVPRGTIITVTGLEEVAKDFIGWDINGTFYHINNPFGKTFTYTVVEDVTFEYTGVK